MTLDPLMITVERLNRHHRQAKASLFALSHFRWLRTVVFVLSALYAVYSLDLVAIFTPLQTNAQPLLLWAKPLLLLLCLPVVASLIYMPILRLIGAAAVKDDLFTFDELDSEITEAIYQNAVQLEKDRYDVYHYCYIDRRRLVKILLALGCGLVAMFGCMTAIPEEAENLLGAVMGTGAWYATVGGLSLGLALFLYPLLSLAYYLTDMAALFLYTRFKPVLEVRELIKPIQEGWEAVLKRREEEEKAQLQREKEAAEAEKARLEEQERKERIAKAEPLYAQAIAADPVDEVLMEKAAKLGHPQASIYVGWNLIRDQECNPYTNAERRKLQKKALDYLSIFTSEKDTEGVFVYLFAKALYEDSLSQDEWDTMLQRARRIKKSGKLPEKYATACDNLIERLVYEVDNAGSYGGGGGLVLGAEDYARIAAAAEHAVSGAAPTYSGDSGAYGYPAELGPSYRGVSGDGI